MTDLSDPQMGELARPSMRQEIKHREMMEINSAGAVFADKLYITPKRMAVVLSFCEDVPNAEESKLRSRVAMSLETFVHFADMMAAVAKQVRDHQAAQQKAQTEANELDKKAMN